VLMKMLNNFECFENYHTNINHTLILQNLITIAEVTLLAKHVLFVNLKTHLLYPWVI
jgi:hypothetical protein